MNKLTKKLWATSYKLCEKLYISRVLYKKILIGQQNILLALHNFNANSNHLIQSHSANIAKVYQKDILNIKS